jgi:hypothetical protein
MIIVARSGTFVKGNVLRGWYLYDIARLMLLNFICSKINQF